MTCIYIEIIIIVVIVIIIVIILKYKQRNTKWSIVYRVYGKKEKKRKKGPLSEEGLEDVQRISVAVHCSNAVSVLGSLGN